MAQSKATTVAQYLAELPPDRRETLAAVRKSILRALPKGYEERMNWGMISYEIPLARFPDTYNKQPLSYAALASQKNHCSLYLMCIYADSDRNKWLAAEFKKAGKKLDMGKSCIRFKRADDLPLAAIETVVAGVSVEQFISIYQASRSK